MIKSEPWLAWRFGRTLDGARVMAKSPRLAGPRRAPTSNRAPGARRASLRRRHDATE